MSKCCCRGPHREARLRRPLVETVGERCRRRLVDDAEHLEARDAAGVAGGGALRVVEIGGHGDDGPIDLGVDIALGRKVRFGAVLQFTEHERGNLGRRQLAIAQADADHAGAIGSPGRP